MEKLPGRKEHLETFFDHQASPEDGHHLSQKPSGEADSNISIFRLRSAHSQVKNLAPYKFKAKATNKTYKKEDALKRYAKWGDNEEATKRNSSRYSSRARSWWVAKDLSPWRKERWGA